MYVAQEVLGAWSEQVWSECGLGEIAGHVDITCQVVDGDTIAYRLSGDGKALLVVSYEYDGAPDGAGYTITEWTMGTEAQQ